MNIYAIRAIYFFELGRTWRTLFQSIASPVILTSLYFVVFGSAIGSRIESIDGISYGAFIVPGLVVLTIMTESIANASFGIYMPRFTGTIYELLSAPVSTTEALLGYIGAAVTKSVVIGFIILATASLFIHLRIDHPIFMLTYLVLISITFSLFGFVLGIWSENFEQLQVVPLLVITPLAFLGGVFYSINMLPEFWQQATLLNPVVYLVSGFRWTFYGVSDLNIFFSLAMTFGFMIACIGFISWVFRSGYRLRP